METETAKPMGALMPDTVNRQTVAMDLPAPSMTSWSEQALSCLPARLDDKAMASLRAMINAPPPVHEPCDKRHFTKCIAIMDILPRRQDDQVTGKARLDLYHHHMGGYSREAMSYLAEQATGSCRWMPTPAECLDILRAWPDRNADQRCRDRARVLMRHEAIARMDDAIARLAARTVSQTEIDAMPEQWKMVAAEKRFLWAWPDGRFTVRRDASLLSGAELDALKAETAAMMAEWARIREAQAAETTRYTV